MSKNKLDNHVLKFPLKRIIKTNIATIHEIDGITTSVSTKNSPIGESFLHVLGSLPCHEIIQHIQKINLEAENQQAFDSLSKWKIFWRDSFLTCKNKTEIFALAALDIAAWDIFSKTEQKPLHQLLTSRATQSVPVYGTTGWLSLSEKELIRECEKYAELNINGFKIRLGHPNDCERVKAVRNYMGPHYRLMLDATQQFNREKGIEIARKMEAFNIVWLEEPVGNDIADLSAVKNNTDIPIAAGENIFTEKDFEEVLQSRAIDIAQPDIIRCGGITGFIAIAKKIESHKKLLCNHLLPELSVSVISAYSNCYFLELDDLLPDAIFKENFLIDANGNMQIPQTIGTGVQLAKDTLKQFISR